MVVANTKDSERPGLALNTSSTQFALDFAQFGVNHGGDPIEGRPRSSSFPFYHHTPVMDSGVGHGSGLGYYRRPRLYPPHTAEVRFYDTLPEML